MAFPDFEKEFGRSGIVVENFQVHIPGFPSAFNPSIIKYQNTLILSFRYIPDRKDNMTSYVGLVALNDDFTAAAAPQILNLRANIKTKSRAEDIRLIIVGDRLYAVYSDNRDEKISKGGFRLYVMNILLENGKFEIGEPECLSEFEGQNPEVREKNWVPFEEDGKLRLAYSIIPHLIFEPRLDGSGICDTIAKSEGEVKWSFGDIRGGTQATLLGNEYLAFFHSSIRIATEHSDGKEIMHYFMGAYTFQKDSPYSLTSISPAPIVGEGFYSGPPFKGYWKPVRAIFPGGFLHDGDFIWLAYGRDDHEIWISKLDRNALMQSLVRLN